MRRFRLPLHLAPLVVAGCGAAPSPATVVIPPGPPEPALAASEPPSDGGASARRPVAAIAWETSEPAARERAGRLRAPLLVWVRADWAVAALSMERTTWVDPAVVEAARGFVALRLDLSSTEGDAQRYAETYGVVGVPMTVFFDARGWRTGSLVGERSPAEIADALRIAADE